MHPANEMQRIISQFSRSSWRFACLLALATAVHLSMQLAAPESLFADATQMLLMPLLGGLISTLARRPRSRTTKLILAALLFSWVGDALPRFMSGDPAFLAMVAGFLVAQLFYVAALARCWKTSILARPWKVLPYGVAFAALLVLCAPGAGSLLVPVSIYGLALASMAVLSTGTGWLGGAGGAIFFLSDALIALRSFADVQIWGMGFWIMLTYVVGQALLACSTSTK